MSEGHYKEMTPQRLACLKTIEAVGGYIDHEHPALKPFLDDNSTLRYPDVFNQCHDAGWLLSGHDDRCDCSTARLTEAGRDAIRSAVGSSQKP